MKYLLALYAFSVLFIIFYMSKSETDERKIITERTRICRELGGDEYLYWSDVCQKVIQERKTETIPLPPK